MDKAAWDQIRSVTARELIAALRRDGWSEEAKGGSAIAFMKGTRIVSIHFHSGKTYGEKMLKGLLRAIGWTPADMRRLKLIK